MTDQFQRIRQLRQEGYSVAQIARIVEATETMVRHAIRSEVRNNTTIGEDQVIDGEPIADRIARLKALIRAGVVVVPRQH